MVTDVYSHILNEDRKKNAQLFEEVFYKKKNLDPQLHDTQGGKMLSVPDGVDAELLAKDTICFGGERRSLDQRKRFCYSRVWSINQNKKYW